MSPLPTPRATSSTQQTHRNRTPNELSTGETHHREPLREGAPGPLPWLPLMHLPLPKGDLFKDIWPNAEKIIEKILDKHNVQTQFIKAVWRSPFPDAQYTKIRQSHTTIYVVAPGESNNRWFLAIDEIRAYLCNIEMQHVSVEIVDPKALEEQGLAPVPQNDIIHIKWPLIEQHVLDILTDIGWNSIDILLKGPIDAQMSEWKTTIVVTLPLDDYADTTEKERLIQKLCWENELDHVNIEFRRATLWFLGDHSQNLGTPTDRDTHPYYEKKVYPGRGMSTDCPDSLGTSGTGTFGGYIELYTDDSQGPVSKGVYGITCWHVVHTGLPPEMRTRFDQSGLNPAESKRKMFRLLCPSKQQHAMNINQLDKSIARFEADPKDKEYLKIALQRRHKATAAWNAHSTLGYLFCGSGITKNKENHRLDWALIKVDSERIGLNILPSEEQWRNDARNVRAIAPFGNTISKIAPNCTSSQFVFKVGKGSGRSIGQSNTIMSTIQTARPDYNYIQLNENEDEDRETIFSTNDTYTGSDTNSTECAPTCSGSCTISTEYAIIGDNKGGSPFSVRGDSGSMVFDEFCNWVGLVVSGNSMIYNPGVTYITDVQHLIRDIEKRTGCRVRLPE